MGIARRIEGRGPSGLQAGDDGLEDIAGEQIAVFAGGESLAAAPTHGRPIERRPEDVHRDARGSAWGAARPTSMASCSHVAASAISDCRISKPSQPSVIFGTERSTNISSK